MLFNNNSAWSTVLSLKTQPAQLSRHRKNQGVGFEQKFNANGVEWEEDQYPKMKFVPQQEKYDPTSFQGTQAQDDPPPQDHKLKGKDKLQEEIDAFEEAPKALVKWVQDYIKFYFIKYNYNSKDSHQVDVDPKEEELESSWGWLRQQTSLIFILARTSAINFHILH